MKSYNNVNTDHWEHPFPPIFFLFYISDSCTARAWKQLCPYSFHTRKKFSSLCQGTSRQHVTYHIQQLQVILGQTTSSLAWLALAADITWQSPFLKSTKTDRRRPSFMLVFYAHNFLIIFHISKVTRALDLMLNNSCGSTTLSSVFHNSYLRSLLTSLTTVVLTTTHLRQICAHTTAGH